MESGVGDTDGVGLGVGVGVGVGVGSGGTCLSNMQGTLRRRFLSPAPRNAPATFQVRGAERRVPSVEDNIGRFQFADRRLFGFVSPFTSFAIRSDASPLDRSGTTRHDRRINRVARDHERRNRPRAPQRCPGETPRHDNERIVVR